MDDKSLKCCDEYKLLGTLLSRPFPCHVESETVEKVQIVFLVGSVCVQMSLLGKGRMWCH